MAEKIKIAFDLDGIIIDKPPFVPKALLEWLFRGTFIHQLQYRFPQNRLEQLIRKLSHFYLFRPPLTQNITLIKKIAQDKRFLVFGVSGRYSFLEKETKIWLKKRKLASLFRQVFLNLKNEQPHLFKEKILRKIKADIFVDDDKLLADYLAQKLKQTKIYYYSKYNEQCRWAKTISSLKEVLE
ncbi:MAG TPA: hypothetical protein VMW25_06530 [Clostridia bacterium]|nr:hypothetical protein [Clostridia bacterium]